MRIISTLLAVLILTACGGDSTAPKEQRGSLVFRLDQQTCTGSGTITFFVDGSSVGSAAMTAGASSPSYSVTAGSHIVGATAPSFNWPSQTVTVPVNATYTALLTC